MAGLMYPGGSPKTSYSISVARDNNGNNARTTITFKEKWNEC